MKVYAKISILRMKSVNWPNLDSGTCFSSQKDSPKFQSGTLNVEDITTLFGLFNTASGPV